MIRTLFNTWSGAFFNSGGGEVQLLNTQRALVQKGVDVQFYDMWKPQMDFDILHQFSMELGNHHVLNNYKTLEKKIALSTIYWHEPALDSFDYWYIGSLFNNSDIFLTNSDAESIKLSKHFKVPIEKFHKVRNAITTDYTTLGNPQLFKSKFNINEKFVLSVANIDRRKNTELLVKACQELNLNLVTIGHIRDIPYYESFKGKYNKHIHLGPITDVEILKSVYLNCDLFALPSLCETPGIAALEAASQGARIVITDQGPTAEYFGEENISLVNPFDFDSIKKGIQEEMNIQRGSTLKNKILENYTWDKAALDTIEGYKKIL